MCGAHGRAILLVFPMHENAGFLSWKSVQESTVSTLHKFLVDVSRGLDTAATLSQPYSLSKDPFCWILTSASYGEAAMVHALLLAFGSCHECLKVVSQRDARALRGRSFALFASPKLKFLLHQDV